MNERESDFALLREFVRQGRQPAFAMLARRHLDLVYATALRKVEDSSGAEEIAMAPADVARSGQQLILVNLLALRRGRHGCGFFEAYRTDLIGLAKGASLVAALIAAVWLFFHGA